MPLVYFFSNICSGPWAIPAWNPWTQGQHGLHLIFGCLKFPKTAVPDPGPEKEGEDFTLLQKWCLSVCSWDLSPCPYLPLSQAKASPTFLHFRVVPQPPWMGTRRKGSSSSTLLVYGTWNGKLREGIAFFHGFVCLLYSTGTSAAPVASPSVTGTQQWWLYPLKSDL